MAMIFPGMDPYLENPHLWPGVHNALVVYLRDEMQPRLQPRYVATIEQRVYIEGGNSQYTPDISLGSSAPEVHGGSAATVAEIDSPLFDSPLLVEAVALEIQESYIAILDRHSGQKVITIIEVVSPSNKAPGPGRDSYLAKQRDVLASTVHLVEIDLLRTGEHVVAVPESLARRQGHYDYLISVNPLRRWRKQFRLYPRSLRERLPRIGIPLTGDDPDVPLDLQTGIKRVYEAGAYGSLIDYQKPCRPPLAPADQAWAAQLLPRAVE